MILTCPGCSARYRVKDGLIPEAGKKVKCKKCGVVFRAFPDGRCEPLTASTQAAPTTPPVSNQPAATATVRVDAEKIQAMVMRQHSAGRDERTPLPDVPQNVVVKHQPLEPPVEQKPAEPRRSFTDFSEGISQSEDAAQDAQDEDIFRKNPFAEEEDDEGFDVGQSPEPQPFEAAEPQPSQDLPRDEEDLPRDEEQEQNEFQFDVPPDEEADDSALKSELDEFRFELPDEPAQDEMADQAEWDMPSEEPTEASSEEAEHDPLATAAMPVAQPESEPTAPDLASDTGFPDIETGDFAGAQSDDPLQRELVSPDVEPPETADAAGPALFQAKIDGTLYPKLTHDVIERWIREGRLLESDQLAEEGSARFKRADQFGEFANLFERYFGKKKTVEPHTKKKKGFFSRMFKK